MSRSTGHHRVDQQHPVVAEDHGEARCDAAHLFNPLGPHARPVTVEPEEVR